jgi:hypothetical protein
MKEQVVEMEGAGVLNIFTSIILFIPKVFVTQSILVMEQQSISKGGCREAV